MKNEWILTIGVTLVSLLVAIGLLRWLAPGLLGIAGDLQLVKVSREVPAFFDNIYRKEHLEGDTFILNDPITRVRTLPLYPNQMTIGPNDLFGFRNREIPTVADIVVIGDSQTYGNNALIDENWPGWMVSTLAEKGAVYKTYNMSMGGWGAVQYLYMIDKALFMQPQALVVAFYTGNDAIDSFQLAYADERWAELRPDTALSSSDIPDSHYPPKVEEIWSVTFKDGVSHSFTPLLRYTSNQPHPVVDAGYEIMAKSASLITDIASSVGIPVYFTIIPTAETVYAEKVKHEGIQPPQEYLKLISAEGERIRKLSNHLSNIPGGFYVDVLSQLSKAALHGRQLYLSGSNGHPLSDGHQIIGSVVAEALSQRLSTYPDGLYTQVAPDDKLDKLEIFLLRNNMLWVFYEHNLLRDNGWGNPLTVQPMASRMLSRYPIHTVNSVEPTRFGPKVESHSMIDDDERLEDRIRHRVF